MVMLSAGNLTMSQSVREMLQVEELDNPSDTTDDHLERDQHVRRGACAGRRGAPGARRRTARRSEDRASTSTRR